MLGKMKLVRVLAVGAFAIAPAALAATVPGVANAATPKTVICTSVTGSTSTQKLAGCTGDTSLGTTGTVTKAGTLVTWAKGGTVTLTVKDTAVTGSKDNCKAPAGQKNVSLITESGSVKSGTGAAAALKGGKTSAKVCLYSKSVALYPHTKFTL